MDDCKQLASQLPQICFNHYFREANRCVDSLARMDLIKIKILFCMLLHLWTQIRFMRLIFVDCILICVVLNLYFLFNFNEFPILPNNKKVEYMWSIMINLLRIYNESQSFGIKGFVVGIVF